MYKHTLTIADQYLAKEQELPKNKTVEGNGTPLHLGGGIGGMVELVMVATKECTLPASASITLELLESEEVDGTYTKAPITSTIHSTQLKKWNKGDCIMRLPLSSYAKPFIKASISTTNANVQGTVSVIPSYLPR
ncbi:MAG: hypothetical protein K2M30_00485 [Desulfovibrionaceae bacterium]|nr:hypothetical protein [Desulfovibrionaceae bacterium]